MLIRGFTCIQCINLPYNTVITTLAHISTLLSSGFEKPVLLHMQSLTIATAILLSLVLFGVLLFSWIELRAMKIAERRYPGSPHPDTFAEEELRFLRSQINPHFLFNSLNAIKLLIQQTRNEEATEYLVDFAKLMRGIVNSSEKQTIPLSKELQLTELFLSLENLRYANAYDFSICISEALDTNQYQVPPMILRSYLERSIRYNRLQETNKRKIQITIEQEQEHLCFIIEDNGIGLESAQQFLNSRSENRLITERGTEAIYKHLLSQDDLDSNCDKRLCIIERLETSTLNKGICLKIILYNCNVKQTQFKRFINTNRKASN